MNKEIILAGFGNVGRSFVELLETNHETLQMQYDLNLTLTGILGSNASIFHNKGIDKSFLLSLPKGSTGISAYQRKLNLPSATFSEMRADILVDATPTNITTGGPGLSYILQAIDKSMDVICIAKGALVSNFKTIMEKCTLQGTQIKYSGATASALPALDLVLYSLNGTTVNSIEGIVNGTTNYILTKMHDEGISYETTLREAQSLGIVEPNPNLDISGIDSACKLLLLVNTLNNNHYSLSEVKIEGIENISIQKMENAKKEGCTIKLIAGAYLRDNCFSLEVQPKKIPISHPLASIGGTNKGVVFKTDLMGRITVSGGASNPRATAATAIKDIINLYRR